MAEMIGADVAEVRALGRTMLRESQRMARTAQQLNGAVVRSQMWRGRDADRFRDDWTARLRPMLSQVETYLQEAGERAAQDADEQERASSDGGAVGGGAARTGSSQTADYPAGDAPEVSPEVAAEWAGMTDEERMEVLQNLVDAYADQHDVDSYPVEFREMPPEDGLVTYGYYNGEQIVFNSLFLDDPNVAINTLTHEMRHGVQDAYGDDATGFSGIVWRVRDSLTPGDAFADAHEGVTQDTAATWENTPYISADDDYEGYRNQPVEVDAREAGGSAAENITVEQLEDLRD